MCNVNHQILANDDFSWRNFAWILIIFFLGIVSKTVMTFLDEYVKYLFKKYFEEQPQTRFSRERSFTINEIGSYDGRDESRVMTRSMRRRAAGTLNTLV